MWPIIMDGNGRWAARRSLPRVAGHRAGGRGRKAHCGTCSACRHRLLEPSTRFRLTHWRRPATEVQSIFWLLRALLRLERARTSASRVRLEVNRPARPYTRIVAARDQPGGHCDRSRYALLLRVAIELLLARRHHERCPERISQLSTMSGYLGASLLRNVLAQELAAERGDRRFADSHWRRNSAFRTSCCGNARTPNFGLPTECGRSLSPATWTPHWPNFVRESAASVVFPRLQHQ